MTTILAAGNYLEGKAHLIEDYEGGGGLDTLIWGIVMFTIFLGPPIAVISTLREKEWKSAGGYLLLTIAIWFCTIFQVDPVIAAACLAGVVFLLMLAWAIFVVLLRCKLFAICLIAAGGLANAELSADEFNEVRNAVLSQGFFFDGTSTIRGRLFYTFCTHQKGGIVAHIPMYVTTVQEARSAFIASGASFLQCADQWKRPLDQLLKSTKSHLEEASNGDMMAVPNGYELEPITNGEVTAVHK